MPGIFDLPREHGLLSPLSALEARVEALEALHPTIELIEKRVLSSASDSETFDIPSTVNNLDVRWALRTDGTGPGLRGAVFVRVNGDSGTNYHRQFTRDGVIIENINTTALLLGSADASSTTRPSWGIGHLIDCQASASTNRGVACVSHCNFIEAGAIVDESCIGNWNGTDPMTEIEIFFIAAQYTAGSTFWLYGGP